MNRCKYCNSYIVSTGGCTKCTINVTESDFEQLYKSLHKLVFSNYSSVDDFEQAKEQWLRDN